MNNAVAESGSGRIKQAETSFKAMSEALMDMISNNERQLRES